MGIILLFFVEKVIRLVFEGVIEDGLCIGMVIEDGIVD